MSFYNTQTPANSSIRVTNRVRTAFQDYAGPIGNGSETALPEGFNHGEYLYFDKTGAVGEWKVGGEQVSIGTEAGQYNQGYNGGDSVAIGYRAAQYDQCEASVAIGYRAARNFQGTGDGFGCVAIGSYAGEDYQGDRCVAIGRRAGEEFQGRNGGQGHSVAVGPYAGEVEQGSYAVAIGTDAGQYNQGNYAIAIGYNAGENDQHNNSIVINATQNNLDSNGEGRLFIKPIRGVALGIGINRLSYDPSTGEIVYSTD